eukprot:gene46259-57687_t
MTEIPVSQQVVCHRGDGMGVAGGLDCAIVRIHTIMNVIDSIVTQAAGIAAVRRDIHAHPELCFEEVRTADVVAGKLTEWGIAVHRAILGAVRADYFTGW